jgi:hypothetical protein
MGHAGRCVQVDERADMVAYRIASMLKGNSEGQQLLALQCQIRASNLEGTGPSDVS